MIVDDLDQADERELEHAIRREIVSRLLAQQLHGLGGGCRIVYLTNSRTQVASGAWNTGCAVAI